MSQLGTKKKQVCITDVSCLSGATVTNYLCLLHFNIVYTDYIISYFSLFSEGSGSDEDSFRLGEIDRQTLMVALADLEYILVRATHGESAQVIG